MHAEARRQRLTTDTHDSLIRTIKGNNEYSRQPGHGPNFCYVARNWLTMCHKDNGFSVERLG